MKIAKYSGKLPTIPFPNGDRVFAEVTIDCDDPFTENTAVDVAPARTNVHFRVHERIHTFDFRVTSA